MLQAEIADGPVFHETLETAVSEISRSQETQVSAELKEALNYLIHLIFHRRSEEERDAFVDVIKAHSPNEKEVEIMAQTAAEALIQQGIEQGARQTSIESILTLLTRNFPEADVTALKSTLEAIEDLNRLKELIFEASSAESFQTFQEYLYA